MISLDFPGGSVDKNPPASAGDTGSIPGPGRFHMPWNQRHGQQSPCTATTEHTLYRVHDLQLRNPHTRTTKVHAS